MMIIHDAIWIEAQEEEADGVRHVMKRIMTTAAQLSVPLEVDIK